MTGSILLLPVGALVGPPLPSALKSMTGNFEAGGCYAGMLRMCVVGFNVDLLGS